MFMYMVFGVLLGGFSILVAGIIMTYVKNENIRTRIHAEVMNNLMEEHEQLMEMFEEFKKSYKSESK